MENGFWLSTIGKTIRWIVFIPVASLGAALTAVLVFLLNTLQGYISGASSQWAYVGAAVFAQLAFLSISYYIIPNFQKIILYILFGIRVFFSFIWFSYPSTSPLSLRMLILQEILVCALSLYLIRRLLRGESL